MGADGDAGGAGPLQCLLVWKTETVQRAVGGGRDGSGVENQDRAEREEPGLKEEARGSCTRQQRPVLNSRTDVSQKNTLCGTQKALCCPHFTEQGTEAQGG